MARKKQSAEPWFSFSVEIEGRVYSGNYQHKNRMVYVHSDYGSGRKTIQCPSDQAEMWAKQAMREMVREGMAQDKQAHQ